MLDAQSAARSVRLESGDVLVFGGPARMLYHAVPHIYPGEDRAGGTELGGGAGTAHPDDADGPRA